jgi:hypothetical protein
MKIKKIAFLALGIWVFSAVLCTVRAGSILSPGPDDLIKSRTYLGCFGTSSTVDGGGNEELSFNGLSGIVNRPGDPLELTLVPTVSRNFGFGVLVGHREGAYAAEVSYWRSCHDSTWAGIMPPIPPITFYGTSLYQSFNLDLKRYLFTQFPTQPFINLGISFPWLIFQKASCDESGRTGDASYGGVGCNLGAGLEIYLGDHFSIMGAAIQRFTGFNSVSGIYQQQGQAIQWQNYSNLTIEGDGFNFMLGATVGFE